MRAPRQSSFLLFALTLPVFAGSVDGIHNFYQVDQHVYRGAQPSDDGFKYLAKLGVKTIVDLREPGTRSKAEEQMVTSTGMQYINVPMSGLTPPTEEQINKILSILENGSTGPVFVHCMKGVDRTGTVIASYRIDHDGWDNTRALKEARDRGMGFYQLPRQNYIRHFKARAVEAKTAPATDTSPTPRVAISQ